MATTDKSYREHGPRAWGPTPFASHGGNMPKHLSPSQLQEIAQAAQGLLAVLKPSGIPQDILQEWDELAVAVTSLETAMGLNCPYASNSATQPIAARPIIDGLGRHIGFWRVCQECRSNLPMVDGGGHYRLKGTVFCSPECMNTWANKRPA